MPPRTSEKDEKAQKARYLNAVARIGTLTAGCKAARVSPNTVYKWREMDEEFGFAEHQARETCADELEAIVLRRAKNRSDVLAIFLLKALRPTKYRETARFEHSGPDGGPIQTEDIGISDDDRASRILAVLERARKRVGRSVDGAESDLGAIAGAAD